MSEFMGKAGFQWFVGVVEDRSDPKTLGRLRVRCLGYHTEGLDKLPTADLPWAHVMNPITSATVSGLGQSPLGAVEGTWVVGFFQDGSDAQQPIIIGTLPGVPSELPDTGSKKGFQDAVNGAYPKYKDETDVNRLAVNDEDLPHSTLTIRKADRTTSIGRADFNEVDLGVANSREGTITLPSDDGLEFNEPETPYDTTYPHNHVYESEAGHIREMDDTPGKERIKGNSNTTVDGGVRVFVNADGSTDDHNYTIQVGNNANVNIQVDKGDVNIVTTQGNINLKSGKNIHMDAAQGIYMKSASVDAEINGDWNETTQNKTESTSTHIMNAKLQDINGDSEVDIDAPTINLN
jgi:hypothetical protein